MFKHFLLPTDGSALSNSAVENAVRLAKDTGAKVTGLHVIAPFHVFTAHSTMLEETRETYEKEARAEAARALDVVTRAASGAGVECDTVTAIDDDPHDAIIETARQKGCDVIAMASHGRKGVKGLLVGSETQKVLTHSSIPVLVYK